MPQTMLIPGENQFTARTVSGSSGTISLAWRAGML